RTGGGRARTGGGAGSGGGAGAPLCSPVLLRSAVLRSPALALLLTNRGVPAPNRLRWARVPRALGMDGGTRRRDAAAPKRAAIRTPCRTRAQRSCRHGRGDGRDRNFVRS